MYRDNEIYHFTKLGHECAGLKKKELAHVTFKVFSRI